MSDEILLERRGALGLVTLNRPQALNTMSLAMYRRFDPALAEWEADPGVQAVVVRGAGDRAFCAGGDVVAIYDAWKKGARPGDGGDDFFREEYGLMRRIHRFAKPYVALMDGVTMGGGAGIAVNGAFRVVTARTLFAMPEVHIGLFPDVGASRFLTLCPGLVGLYLALTGTRIGADDALYCGFGTDFVPHERLDALTDRLAAMEGPIDGARDRVRAAIADFAAHPCAAALSERRAAIDRCFSGASVASIQAALAEEGADWARAALEAMGRASPLSLAIAFRQYGLGHGMDVESALVLEYRLTQHCLAGRDFYEGIRALLIDKDRRPRWQHADADAIGETAIDAYFAGLGDRELRFA